LLPLQQVRSTDAEGDKGLGVRIVVFTFESVFSNAMVGSLLRACGSEVVGIARSDGLVADRGIVGSVRFALARTGLGFPLRKGIEVLVGRAAMRWMEIAGSAEGLRRLRTMADAYHIPVVSVADARSPTLAAAVRAWRPDVVVSVNFNQRIPRRILDLAAIGSINVHGSLLPRNRGLFPYFWALSNGDRELGVTVHWIEDGFDTGDVVIQRALPIEPSDTILSLESRCALLGGELVIDAFARIRSGETLRQVQDAAYATYHSWPGRDDVRRFRRNGRVYGSIVDLWRFVRTQPNACGLGDPEA